MKRIAMSFAALLFALPLSAQDYRPRMDRTDFYIMPYTQDGCDEHARVTNYPLGLCVPNVNTFIMTPDRSIRAYAVTIKYRNTEGSIEIRSGYVDAAPFLNNGNDFATTVSYIETPALGKIDYVTVTPLYSKGTIQH